MKELVKVKFLRDCKYGKKDHVKAIALTIEAKKCLLKYGFIELVKEPKEAKEQAAKKSK